MSDWFWTCMVLLAITGRSTYGRWLQHRERLASLEMAFFSDGPDDGEGMDEPVAKPDLRVVSTKGAA